MTYQTLRVISVLSLLLLGACKSTQGMRTDMPKSDVSPGMSRLVLYQTGSTLVRVENRIMIDGLITCGIAPDEAIAWDLPPGNHDINVHSPTTTGSSVLTFQAEAGKTTYISSAPNTFRSSFGILGSMIVSNTNTAKGGFFAIEEVSEELGLMESEPMIKAGCPYAGRKPASPPAEARKAK